MGKKLLRAALLAAALVLMLTTAAFAVEGDIHPVNATSAGKSGEDGYTVTYTNAAIADKQCVLLVVAGTHNGSTPVYEISESTIQYIDQKAADGSGSVSFTYIPKSTPDSLVLLGVEGQSGPILLATVESKGVTVTGSVAYQGATSTATVALKDKNSGEVVYSTNTDNSGAYTLTSVATGEYNLYVTKASYLTYTLAVSISEEMTLPTVDIKRMAGDIDGSGKVNTADLTVLLRNFNTAHDASDLDKSGKVNTTDLSALLSSFNAVNYVG